MGLYSRCPCLFRNSVCLGDERLELIIDKVTKNQNVYLEVHIQSQVLTRGRLPVCEIPSSGAANVAADRLLNCRHIRLWLRTAQ
jgi:hypothetical protein